MLSLDEKFHHSYKKSVYVTRLGERGVSWNDEKVWHRGRRFKPKSDVTASKKILFQKLYFYEYVLSSPFHWHFDVVVHLDITFCVGNMLISANIGPITLNFGSFSAQEFVTIWGMTRWGGGPRRKMTKCDIGEGCKKYRFVEWHTVKSRI